MAARNLDRSFGFLLHDVSRLLRIEYNRRVRHLGLTRSQWRVIVHLSRNEGSTQTFLADILEIENATLARLLDRLEADGWIERRPSPTDRRAKHLYLTEKPAAIIDAMSRISSQLQHDTLDGLAPNERERLIDTLLGIKRNLLQMTSAIESPVDSLSERKVAAGD
ncbi:MAG: MarR family transcriptional regulator [Alphaproteobacteria bacterium]|nr:MarR family transcriptional regulator [Alphaproteobacteria bacterium]